MVRSKYSTINASIFDVIRVYYGCTIDFTPWKLDKDMTTMEQYEQKKLLEYLINLLDCIASSIRYDIHTIKKILKEKINLIKEKK